MSQRCCEVKGCPAPVFMRVVDRSQREHPSCLGHISLLVARLMRPDDTLAVVK